MPEFLTESMSPPARTAPSRNFSAAGFPTGPRTHPPTQYSQQMPCPFALPTNPLHLLPPRSPTTTCSASSSICTSHAAAAWGRARRAASPWCVLLLYMHAAACCGRQPHSVCTERGAAALLPLPARMPAATGAIAFSDQLWRPHPLARLRCTHAALPWLDAEGAGRRL